MKKNYISFLKIPALSWVLAFVLSLFSISVFAHHPLDGVAMTSAWHGFISGIAHPVLGLDHLLFISVVSLFSVASASRITTMVVAMAGVFTGIILSLASLTVPLVEFGIAISLCVLLLNVVFGSCIHRWQASVLVYIFSIWHGAAYASVLVEQAFLPLAVLCGFVVALPVAYAMLAWFSERVDHLLVTITGESQLLGKILSVISAGLGVQMLFS